ncbi:MAG: YggS family pyridoxal phosphate-dependent enzyme [Pseudomonadota bacterium]
MSSIQTNLNKISKQILIAATSCGRLPDQVQLIAVSKRKSVDIVKQAIKAGVLNLGENYIQEAIEKIDIIGKDAACWHFIGHLQSNKARVAVQYFDIIHTVDSHKLAKEINKQAQKIGKIQKILVQVNISDEKNKSGTTREDTFELVSAISSLEHISLQGLMCMPPYFSEPEKARHYFKQLKALKQDIMARGLENVFLDHLSMGMSNDFKVAIEEGATMVRIGTSIFGERD